MVNNLTCPCGNTQVRAKLKNWAYDNDVGASWLVSAKCRVCRRSVSQTKPSPNMRAALKNAASILKKASKPRSRQLRLF